MAPHRDCPDQEPVKDSNVVVEELTFFYSGAKEPALSDINLTFQRGEIALLIGATGAGKSTLYMCLNGLIPHLVPGRVGGRVLIEGTATSDQSISALAQKVGFVFQSPDVQLFSHTVREELAFGPENLGLAKSEILRRIQLAATTIGITELLEREPAYLSGGQQQSVAIGAIWAMLPEILILDEPTSNLDPQSSRRVLELIRALNTEHGKTILIAEHKIDAAAHFADSVLVMHEGRIEMQGEPRQVFSQAEELHRMGLVAPTAAEVAFQLSKYGYTFDSWPLTAEEGIQAFGELL
ncbi:MAG: ATP-binding cassette domain-containing protein [Caldilineaceae bacterium SB0661_bin_32]|uniref:ATP-binding cassette domain-containing protein n=1 Tax=Caldilineaceae bacterium SB0661_bin_32 TaxID=2605255 RepID=A0A6B1DCZ3_9CHLR|nr:ATP-binding cassette domain-containing protein [Caldilineaceae bacterium SB0665_bin_25]MYC97506.1 ATP-binding cassette domain-containing protein [Caldilineaceae bacterium SB0661_bin_32]